MSVKPVHVQPVRRTWLSPRTTGSRCCGRSHRQLTDAGRPSATPLQQELHVHQQQPPMINGSFAESASGDPVLRQSNRPASVGAGCLCHIR